MAKVMGKMDRVTDEQENKAEKKPLRILQSFDTSHLIDDSKVKTVEININDIRERKNNNFIKGKIEELASSIKEVGLQQPIVLKKTEDKTEKGNVIYEVVAGHRRLAAYKLLCDEVGETKFPEDNPYLKIQARVLKNNDDEDKIYVQTNSTTRNVTLFEALLNCDSEEIDHKSDAFKEKYNKMFYPDGNIPKKEEFNVNSEIKYIQRLIQDNFPNLDNYQDKTVQNRRNLIKSLCDEAKKAVLDGKLSRDNAEKIAKYSKDLQPEKLAIMLSGKELDNEPVKKEVEPEIKNSYEEMMKVDKQLRNVGKCNIKNLNTENWSANSKAYLKQMNKVLSEIKKLESMPKK